MTEAQIKARQIDRIEKTVKRMKKKRQVKKMLLNERKQNLTT